VPVDNDLEELSLAGDPPEGAVIADATELPFEDGTVEGVLCSNMLEHTPDAEAVVAEIARVLRPGGWAYVSWTNWYSPWGGHLMAPYHYLGPKLGPRVYERFHGKPRKHAYGETLWAVHVGTMLRFVGGLPRVRIEHVEPRYWPRLAFIARIPLVREVLMWNCVIRMRKLP
jgi:SAM-dependent methyltransferase